MLCHTEVLVARMISNGCELGAHQQESLREKRRSGKDKTSLMQILAPRRRSSPEGKSGEDQEHPVSVIGWGFYGGWR
jgi:hypothetical protein